MKEKKEGFCIRCGCAIPYNLQQPFCSICGGSCSACNRFSSSEDLAMYCHRCGDPVYVEESHPLCDQCDFSIKELK